MRKLFVLVIALMPLLTKAQINFTVKGKVPASATAFKRAYFSYSNGKDKDWVSDSVELKNGEFAFSGNIDNVDVQRASLSYGNSSRTRVYKDDLQLFIGVGDHITIDGVTSLRNADIKGSPQSVAYRETYNLLSAKESPDELMAICKKLIEEYPDSKMPLAALSTRFNPFSNMSQNYSKQIPEVIKLYGMFSPRIKATREGIEYGQALEKLTHLMIGGTLMDFSAKTVDGKTVRLSDLRGKYVLVDFWASWCIPCRAEFPYLKKAYARFKNKNFEIVGYSIDEDKSLWVSALENDDVPWMNVSNLKGYKDPTAVQYAINAVPSNFLIGPDGKVIAVNLRGELVEPKLEQLIK
jgi:thiol-disulfide isomerase/thioredoxin